MYFVKRIMVRQSNEYALDTETKASLKGHKINIPRISLQTIDGDGKVVGQKEIERDPEHDLKLDKGMDNALARKKAEFDGRVDSNKGLR